MVGAVQPVGMWVIVTSMSWDVVAAPADSPIDAKATAADRNNRNFPIIGLDHLHGISGAQNAGIAGRRERSALDGVPEYPRRPATRARNVETMTTRLVAGSGSPSLFWAVRKISST